MTIVPVADPPPLPAACTWLQYAALPWRLSPEKEPRFLLITSRGTGRWVVPKGWPMRGRTGCQVAALEAFEEAGVTGDMARHSIGFYRYRKHWRDGNAVDCRVEVFPLRVRDERPRWPEQAQRTRTWFTPAEAAGLVREAELRALMLRFAEAVINVPANAAQPAGQDC